MATTQMAARTTVETGPERPRTRGEAEAALAEIGSHRRALETIQAAMNAQLAAAKAAHERDADPHRARLELLEAGLEAWADEHREELLEDGGKTARLATGLVRWRRLPDRVNITGKVETVIAALKAAHLPHMVRTREEINRNAVISEPNAVKGIRGIRIEPGGEAFVAEPFAADLAPG